MCENYLMNCKSVRPVHRRTPKILSCTEYSNQFRSNSFPLTHLSKYSNISRYGNNCRSVAVLSVAFDNLRRLYVTTKSMDGDELKLKRLFPAMSVTRASLPSRALELFALYR